MPDVATVVLALLGSAGSARAHGDPAVAALQIALHARNLYRGPKIDFAIIAWTPLVPSTSCVTRRSAVMLARR